MAGVAGIRHFAAEDAPPRMLAAMLATLQHRYRAGAETWASGSIELAVANDPHRSKRPSFIAPPTSRCGRYTCAFDGVITNRSLLRERIASSWCRVRVLQDAELILEHISAFGVEETLSRLDGAFALAVWDHQTQSLTLGRDRFGLRSICFRVLRTADVTLHHVAFASEGKALAMPDAANDGHTETCSSANTFITPAHRQLFSRLTNLSLPAAGSADGEIIDVAPGHAVTFRADGVRVEQTFASLNGLIDDPGHRLELRALSPSDRIDRVIDAATRSIRAQTDGAENIICLVGGDLASTVLAALTVRAGIKIRLLHVDTGCAQRRGTCEALAERLSAPLITMRATDAAVRANLVDATWHLETPMPTRSLAVPLYQACHRAAGLRAEILLHGGGARDLFGTPLASLRRNMLRFTNTIWPRNLQNAHAASGHSTLERLARGLSLSARHEADNDGECVASQLLGALEGRVRRAERLSAAWGTELRMPLLTEELVALATALPVVHPTQLLSLLRHPRAACAMLSPLGQMAGRMLSPDLIGRCTLSGEDLPDADLPVDADFLESGSLMQWLGCGRRDQLDAALQHLTAADRQELLLCDIWARLFVTRAPCDDVTRALLGHPPAGLSADRAPEQDGAPARTAATKRVAA